MFKAPSNAMWFLPTLFLTSIAFFVAQLWSEDDEKALTLLILVIGSFGYSMSLRGDKFASPWHIETVPMSLLFFLMGYLFIKHYEFMMELLGDKKRQILIFFACLAAGFGCARYNVKISMAVNVYGSFLLFMGAVIGFSIACTLVAMWLPKWNLFKFIGRNTIVYLAFHAPMLRFMEVYSETTKMFYDAHPFWAGTIVFIAMIPVTWVFEKYFSFLLGRKKKVKKA
jgi:fucose 4-O-acetylase-like acetyltransferase